MVQQMPAGWYPDSNDPQLERYWTGAVWLNNTRSKDVDIDESTALLVPRPTFSSDRPSAPDTAVKPPAITEPQPERPKRSHVIEIILGAALVVAIAAGGYFAWTTHETTDKLAAANDRVGELSSQLSDAKGQQADLQQQVDDAQSKLTDAEKVGAACLSAASAYSLEALNVTKAAQAGIGTPTALGYLLQAQTQQKIGNDSGCLDQ